MKVRLRRIAGRVLAPLRRRRIARAQAEAALAAEQERQRVLEGQREQHRQHVEERLHAAQFELDRLRDLGLTQALSDRPEQYARWLTWRPPGHFYSPVPRVDEVEARADWLWRDPPDSVPGIDLRPDSQLELFTQVAKYAAEHPIFDGPTPPWRYHSDNPAYGHMDALVLHGMLRHIRPRRLIEIGSGYSSAMTMDTVEHYLDGATELTFVEPYPELLESLLARGGRNGATIIPKPIEQVPHTMFEQLEPGDVLFIDSTHVVKTGNDVTWLYGEVLPRVPPGVWIHIHDIFYPFEYPRNWVMEGRAWAETYVVRAYLTHNPKVQIELFNDWLAKLHADRIEAEAPVMMRTTGSALWLRTCA